MTYATDIAASVVPYQSSDKTALRAFQQEHFGPGSRQCDDRFFEWLFERNPNRKAEEPVLWICKRDGAIVGQQASIPVLLKVGDAQYRAAWGVDLMVHPDWRLKGIGPALSARHEKSADILLGLGISDQAYRAYRRAGWTDLGMLPLFVRPLNSDACASALGGLRWLATLAPGPALGGSARLVGRFARAITNLSLEPVPAFDPRIDGVWALCSGDYPVLVKRDYASLRWRFDEVPTRTRYQRLYLMRRGCVVGYAVTRQDTWRGNPIARIVDYLAERKSLPALLALVIQELSSAPVVAVFVEQFHVRSARALNFAGSIRVAAPTRFMLKVDGSNSPQSFAASVREPDHWYVTRGDADGDYGNPDSGPLQNHG